MFIIFGEFLGMIAGAFMCVFVSTLGDRTASWKSSAGGLCRWQLAASAKFSRP